MMPDALIFFLHSKTPFSLQAQIFESSPADRNVVFPLKLIILQKKTREVWPKS